MSWQDEQKSTHGSFATIIWIVTSIVLFLITDGGPGLISWQAALFILVGMFAAAIVLGMIGYLLQRVVASVLMRAADAPLAQIEKTARALGLLLLVLNVALAIAATWFTFNLLFGG